MDALEARFKSKKDIHCYMTHLLNVFLPRLKQCRLSFLQDIMAGNKMTIDSRKVEMRDVNKNWNDWCPKNVWPLIKDNVTFLKYVPSEEMKHGRYPDKFFFWGIAFTVIPEWANKFYDLVVKKRTSQINGPEAWKTRKVVISKEWEEKLKQFEYQSKFKRGKRSVMLKQEIRPFKKRDTKKIQELINLSSKEVYNEKLPPDEEEESEIESVQIIKDKEIPQKAEIFDGIIRESHKNYMESVKIKYDNNQKNQKLDLADLMSIYEESSQAPVGKAHLKKRKNISRDATVNQFQQTIKKIKLQQPQKFVDGHNCEPVIDGGTPKTQKAKFSINALLHSNENSPNDKKRKGASTPKKMDQNEF